MNKILHCLLVSLLALFLTACNIQTVEQFEQMENKPSADSLPPSEQLEAEEQTPSVENDTAEEKQEVKESEIGDKAPLEEIDKNSQQKTIDGKQQPKHEADKKQEDTKLPSTITDLSTTKQADNKQQTKTINSSTDKQKNAEPKKRTVKISIRVDTLLKHWEKLDSSLQSDRVLIMDEGSILFDGPPKEILNSLPANHAMITALPAATKIFHLLNGIGRYSSYYS
ncbi:hypothetical protein LSPH24S_01604 [Lysinibacillus sphaericus]